MSHTRALTKQRARESYALESREQTRIVLAMHKPTRSTAELADLAELEHQRETCTSADFPVRAWRSIGGEVLVRGVNVFGPDSNKPLRAVDQMFRLCSECSRRNPRFNPEYTTRAVLWCRYEHALDRPFYWFRAASGCPLCEKQAP